MNQEEFNNAKDQYLGQIHEIEAQLRHQGNSSMQHTTDDIKKLIEIGKIPENLGTWYIQYIDEQNRLFSAWQSFCADEPDLSAEERMVRFHGLSKTLSFEDMIKQFESMVKLGKINTMLLANGVMQPIEANANSFNNTAPDGEFLICRMMADPLNNVPKMLDSFSEPELINSEGEYQLYEIESTTNNSSGDLLKLYHRFRAQGIDDAKKRRSAFVNRITGRQKKIFEACWAMASQKYKRMFTCKITELMDIANPNRKNTYFNTKEKVEFYQDLIDLSETQLIVQKKEKKNKNKKLQQTEYKLPFITIHKTVTNDMKNTTPRCERYPNEISLSVLHNPLYETEKMYGIGAGIKYTTFELHPDDVQLAEWIQIRKNQFMKSDYITFTDRNGLLKLANIDGIAYKGMANRRLLQKFERLKKKGIILDYPDRITEPLRIKIR